VAATHLPLPLPEAATLRLEGARARALAGPDDE
jgi:hypothetical protein